MVLITQHLTWQPDTVFNNGDLQLHPLVLDARKGSVKELLGEHQESVVLSTLLFTQGLQVHVDTTDRNTC